MPNSFSTPYAIAHQAPLSMGFSGQEHWSGLPFPHPGDLPDPWAAACQASLSPTFSQSLPKFTSIELVMLSNHSSSATHFSSCPQSFPAYRSFLVSQFFASGGQSIGASASASVLPMNIQGWFPYDWLVWPPPCFPTTFSWLIVSQDSVRCYQPLIIFQSSDQVGSVSAWVFNSSLQARAPGAAHRAIYADIPLSHPHTFIRWGDGTFFLENTNYNWLKKG